MSVQLFTESVDSANLTLTNCGANSDETLLKDRDLDSLGVDSPSDANTKQIEISYSAATTVEYTILGNLTISAASDIDYYYDDGSPNLDGSQSSVTPTNDVSYYEWQASRSESAYRIDIDPAASCSVDLACIFQGTPYTFPVDYQYGNSRVTYQQTEVMRDIRGYPYGQTIHTAKKYIWEVNFHLTKTQMGNLETQLENVDYNCKPFFLYDTNIDTNYHLVYYDGSSLNGKNLAYDYFEVGMRFVEIGKYS